ncbi:cupin domain-containing protein [Actinokineospora sp. PR83]|uniref:cupin domain-containing protein n=1 Tax=Actinokineospora sp. PR83 TaxID=2884908 RepID=UPI001F473469|nr:cupin domain-containing protein [Actinokineospora sp. PR83]MCG8919907.1 cupin domain-containing protein [Actinokineospora sp. PR83]
MSYLGTTGEHSARFRPVDETIVLDRPTTSAHFVAPGSVTDGQFGLFRWDMAPASGGPARHFHKTFSESFYVIDGTVRLDDGERTVDATAGDFLYVPMGGIHAFANVSDEPASMLILFAPGPPREQYFLELAEIAESGRELSAEEWTEFYARHDQYMV